MQRRIGVFKVNGFVTVKAKVVALFDRNFSTLPVRMFVPPLLY